jgi:RecA/RadA recombinase
MIPKNGFSWDLDQFDNADDMLDRAGLAQTIANELRDSRKCPDGRVLGLYGSWGAGKSHVLAQVIKNCLDQNENAGVYIIPCIFKAWRYETEGDLAPGLIRSLIQLPDHEGINTSLKLFDKDKSAEEYKKIGKELLKIVLELSIATIPAGQVVAGALTRLGKQLADSSIDSLTKQPEDDDASIDKVQKKLHQLVTEILEQAKRKNPNKTSRLVVFIDDLDRCSPKNMVRLFEWLKNHLLVENCVYVLGLDHVAAARAIVGEYKNYLKDDKDLAYGLRYLEKLVDSEYELGGSDKLEFMAIRDLYSGDPEYNDCHDIKQLVEKIERGQIGGTVRNAELLLKLQCLRTPRTMLKVIAKFTRAISAFSASHWDVERSNLSAYPFWILFMVAIYYRLDPNEFTRFVSGESTIYKLIDGQENVELQSVKDENPFGPMADFEGFAARFTIMAGKEVKPPKPDKLRMLAQMIHQS